MNKFKEFSKQREQKLLKVIKKKEEELKKAPKGTLWVSKYGKGYQYFYHTDNSKKKRKYLKKSEEKLINALAVKEYNHKVLECARKEYALLKKLNKIYENNTMENVYEKMSMGKRCLINPIWLPDDLYIENWNSYHYEGLKFKEDAPEYYSDKGERMRSKSEIIIANILNKNGIPYRYECPIKLKSGEVYYPDFTVLNVKERKEMYWEHLGLMDDYDYRERNLAKILKYEANGLFMGDKLLLTFETSTQPLSTVTIERVVNKYLR